MSSVIGVIADTHGMVRAEALGDSDHIIHAGDVGSPDVLDALRTICPVSAIRGNNDSGEWASELSRSEIVEVDWVGIQQGWQTWVEDFLAAGAPWASFDPEYVWGHAWGTH